MFHSRDTNPGQIYANVKMIDQIVFEIFVLYNITQIITESSLFESVRQFKVNNKKILHPLLSCFLCTSVWISFLLTFVLFDYASHLGYQQFSWFLNGLFFSSVTWFIHIIEIKLSK